jgi:hypothetical protein
MIKQIHHNRKEMITEHVALWNQDRTDLMKEKLHMENLNIIFKMNQTTE